MAAPAAVLSILVRANTGKATQSLVRFNQSLGATESTAHKATKAVSTFAKVTAVGVGVGLGYAVKKAADFEEQIDALGAVTRASARDLERFRKQAMKAGADTKFSALDAAVAQTELAKGGLSVRNIMRGGLKSALALAAAGELELGTAAKTTANAMGLFGLRGKESMKVADALAKAANATTADVGDFALALQQGGSAAKQAGLSFTETVVGLEALAKSGIRGSDAGTSLKTSMVQLLTPTKKQHDLMKKLGLDFVDGEGNFKNLADVADMLRSRLGGMSAAQRTSNLAMLAGTDGIRTLAALYDAGGPRVRRWAKGLEESGTAAEVAATKQDNLKGKLEQLRGSVETAAIAIGTKMLPTLTRAVEKVTAVINDPKLTNAEKFQRLAEMMGEAFQKAIPVIADSAAKAAPVVAGAFVKGFLAAGVWGRLAIGAFLLSRMGGRPAFMKIGAAGGAAMGTGMATGVAASGLKGKLVGLMKGWGPTLAVGLGLAFGPELFKIVKQQLASSTENFDLPKHGGLNLAGIIGGSAGKALQDMDNVEAKLLSFGDTAEKSFRQAQKAGDALRLSQLAEQARSLASQFPEHAKSLGRFADAAVEAARKAAGGFKDMKNMSGKSLTQIATKTANVAFDIQNTLGFRTEAARKALAKNFAGAAQAVRRYMDASGKTTKEGLALIEKYMILALKYMGFSRKEAVTLRAGRDPFTGKAIGGKQNLTGKQRGGPINMGAPSGDSVPAMLERGEYVLNRTAVRKVGRGALDKLNFGAAPRFQGGGIVELLHPGNDPKGHHDHLHVAMSTYGAIVALGKKLQSLGWLVGQHPAFGGGHLTGHSPTGYHPKGLAIDVNWPDAGQERAKIAALLPMLGGPLGAVAAMVAPVLNRLIADGPASPLKGVVQGALDIGRSGAQAVLNKAAATTGATEGAELGNFSGPWTQVMAQIAGAKGWSLADWQRLVQKESGGNPKARNPSSGAFGLGQFLGATARSYAKYGALSTDPVQQIQAMAKYISDRYGNPSSALAFHGRNNWYSQGGIARMGAGGLSGAVGKTLKKIGKAKSAKIARGKVDTLLEKIKDVGLPSKLQSNLRSYENTAAIAGEMADRASGLTTDDPNGNSIFGIVGGKNEAQWLEEQLQALFNWRNALIRAKEIIAKRRDEIANAIGLAVMTRDSIAMKIKSLEKRKIALAKSPAKNKAQIKAVKDQLADIKPKFAALKDRIIPGLTGKRTSLGTAAETLSTNLTEVQGIGSPMGVLQSLPTVGVLGGNILTAQMALRDLAARPTVSDTDTSEDSERSSLLEQLLREANLRTAVSEAQFKVFKDMPQFATGGIVPGVVGAPIPAVVHAGEGVFTQDQMAAMGGTAPNVTINVAPGMEWLKKFISVQVEDTTRRQARQGARRLPGGGGGLR